MNSKVFIFDVDGTLIDSYPLIVSSAKKAAEVCGVKYEYEDVYRCVIEQSVTAFLERVCADSKAAFETVLSSYRNFSRSDIDTLKPMRNAVALLEALRTRGDVSHIFTHRGVSTMKILENNRMTDYFTEVVTSADGFARKPSPEGLDFIIDKYGYDRSKVYYVGDRTIDIDCAYAAGVKGILYDDPRSYSQPNGREFLVVDDLLKIAEI